MPVLVNCDELQPGMKLAEAFVWKGRTMLPGGKVLNDESIETLRRRYPGQAFKVGDPVLDSIAEFEDDGKEREIASLASHQVSEAMSQVHERFQSRTALGGVDFQAVSKVVGDVMEYLKENSLSAALLSQQLDSGSYLAGHAGNTFYLSMVLGSAVRDYIVRERQRLTSAGDLSGSVAMDLFPLGLGVMLMDVGMFPLIHLFEQDQPLTESDRQMIEDHPAAGADMLPASSPAAAKMVIRTHHENFNGTGYPSRMSGRKLHVFTRIARICDAFDAATATRTYREAKSSTQALWEMTAGPNARYYDPILTKVFASLIQPFPIGAKVKLEDGRSAVVVRYNRKCPFKPTVIVAYDERGNRLAKEQLQGPLRPGDANDLRIQSFGGEDVSYIYDVVRICEAAPPAGQPEAPAPFAEAATEPAAFKTLYEAAVP